jgi:hypothetical protein
MDTTGQLGEGKARVVAPVVMTLGEGPPGSDCMRVRPFSASAMVLREG